MTYRKISPFVNNLFDISEKIEDNQKITDSTFTFLTLSNDTIRVNVNDGSNVIHFWDINNNICQREIPKLEEYFSRSNKKDKLYLVAINSIDSLKEFSKSNSINFTLFKTDTSNLSLKYKYLMFPYTIEIKDGLLIKSYLGRINLD